MLKINLDEAMDAAERAVSPWDFTLIVGGKEYPTRPLLTFELGTLKRLDQMAEADQRTFFTSLFAGDPAPDLSGWDVDKLGAAAVAIVTVFSDRAKKKSRKLQGIIAREASMEGMLI